MRNRRNSVGRRGWTHLEPGRVVGQQPRRLNLSGDLGELETHPRRARQIDHHQPSSSSFLANPNQASPTPTHPWLSPMAFPNCFLWKA
jgi:hypothetical protein